MARRYSDEEVAPLYVRYEAGESLRQIARGTGRTATAIKELFVRRGWRLRTRHEAAKLRAHPDPYVLALYHRYRQGESVDSIGDAIGMSSSRMRTLFRKRGLPIRTVAESLRLRGERQRSSDI